MPEMEHLKVNRFTTPYTFRDVKANLPHQSASTINIHSVNVKLNRINLYMRVCLCIVH